MKTTRKGTIILLENGVETEINEDFAKELLKTRPKKYKLPGKIGPKKNLKPVVVDPIDLTKQPEGETANPETDGEFTLDDLLQLSYKELQEMGKNLNAEKGLNIKINAKKKELANQLFKEANK